MNEYIEKAKDAIEDAMGNARGVLGLARAYGQLLSELEAQLDYCMKCLTEKEAE